MPQVGPEHIRGSLCALVTPFKDGAVDARAFADLVDWHIAEGTQGLVPCGTTGESPTLELDEHDQLIRTCIEAAAGRVPVIAGTGSNSTAAAIERSKEAQKAGADAIMLVAPYYNKPTQEGLYQHFKTIAEAIEIPVLLYNVPARTVTDIAVETVARLAEIPNIVGLKDATSDMSRVARHRADCGSDFILLSGEDPTAVEFVKQGGQGCISVTANAAPGLCAQMQTAALNGDFDTAQAIDAKLAALHKALFLETSPAPVKFALSLMGKCGEDVRLPLVAPMEATREKVRDALAQAGIVEG